MGINRIRKAKNIKEGTRELATVIEGVCGDGTSLEAPCIIFKAKEFQSEWFKNLPGVPPHTLFGKSPNGWTDEEMGARFLERNLGPDSLSAVKAQGHYRLLIFDGHNSHVNSRFLTYCLDNKVIPLCLPPHTTHRLQPLDIAIFSSYKHFYRKEVRQRWARREWGIGKENFYEIVSIACRKSFTATNI